MRLMQTLKIHQDADETYQSILVSWLYANQLERRTLFSRWTSNECCTRKNLVSCTDSSDDPLILSNSVSIARRTVDIAPASGSSSPSEPWRSSQSFRLQSLLNDFTSLLQWNRQIYSSHEQNRVENVLIFLREQMITTDGYVSHVSQVSTRLSRRTLAFDPLADSSN